jgi:integrase/recombinase XerD
MLDHVFRRPSVRDRIRANLLGEWLPDYISYLVARGHAPHLIQEYARSVEHFGSWLASEHLAPEAITRATIRSFLRDHLPACRCPGPAPTTFRHVRAALNHLLQLPGGPTQRARPAAPPSPVDAVLDRYRNHLRDICGLTEVTCSYRLQYAREFLGGKFGEAPIDWADLRPADPIAFVEGYAARCRPGTAQVVASSLRSLLRFLQLHGHCAPALVAAVPRIPRWSLDRLPRTMSDDQLRRFLGAFDRSTPAGRRDYAMARCQVDLGLRAGEVAALCLEDLDWRRGILRVASGKGGRARELPLPEGIGCAIAEYLRRGRPATACRRVFVRHTLPVGMAISRGLIAAAMRRAFARVEGCARWAGTHVLRHTAATRLHRHGASLKEVADVLGHLSLDTTAIYTKVDLPALAAVALPWPEEQP